MFKLISLVAAFCLAQGQDEIEIRCTSPGFFIARVGNWNVKLGTSLLCETHEYHATISEIMY